MADYIDLTEDANQKQPIVVDVASESEDEDLKLAIAMSLQDQQAQACVTNDANTKAKTEPQIISHGSGLASLDRKAMEAERLARLKRKRALDDDEQGNIQSVYRPVSPPRSRKLSKTQIDPKSMTFKSTAFPSKALPNPFSFTDPKVLLTSHPSRHTAKGLTAISLRDVVSAPKPSFKLKSVLLSSFIADFDWLLPHFDTQSTSFVLVLHAQGAEHRQLLQSDFGGVPNVKLILPKCMGGSGNMHSKLMLLFFKSDSADEHEICRLVTTSANLTPTDWGVGQVMENVVFVVDLPKKALGSEKVDTKFGQRTKQQLRAMDVPDQVLQRLDGFDFTATEHLHFLFSASQSLPLETGSKSMFQSSILKNHSLQKSPDSSITTIEGDQARVGLLALSDAVSSLGLAISPSDSAYPLRIDFITSSLGNLSGIFIRQLHDAACGNLDLTSVIKNKSRQNAIDLQAEQLRIDNLIQEHLRIYFPSDRTVRASKGGPVSAGTICFQRKWWDDNDIIKNCLYDCIGNRGDGILMHSKILYVRFNAPKQIVDDNGPSRLCVGYAYVGSANLSESAWGRVTYDAKMKQPKMTCRNWESGVVIPIHIDDVSCLRTSTSLKENDRPEQKKKADRLDDIARDLKGLSLSDIFSSIVPVPMQESPTLQYADGQLTPWFFRD